MHGIVFNQLQLFVARNYGPLAWFKIIKESGTKHKFFMPTEAYDDAEMMKIVSASEKVSGASAADILDGFGYFIAPNLVKIFVKDSNWDAMDVLENTEKNIHKQVRLQTPGATPPRLNIIRPTPNRVEIHYTSERKLCFFAYGLVRGILDHYQEETSLSMPSCMSKGDPVTRIIVEKKHTPAQG